jgi:tRNA(His) 5'-end guanylyltransferase
MVETTKFLVKEAHCRIGYTQSDEISLVWKADSFKSATFFDGKIQKMVSILASKAAAFFARAILESDLAKFANRMPHFDCRVISLPTETEAANMFLWRTMDATKNAVSMAARHYYSHKALHGQGRADMQEMLFAKGVNFNDYPPAFKQGTFVRRVTERRKLPETTIARLQFLGRTVDPNELHERSSVKEIEMPIFSKVTNREDVIFHGNDPILTIESR